MYKGGKGCYNIPMRKPMKMISWTGTLPAHRGPSSLTKSQPLQGAVVGPHLLSWSSQWHEELCASLSCFHSWENQAEGCGEDTMRPWGEGWEAHSAAAGSESDGGCIPGGEGGGVGGRAQTAFPFRADGNSLCAFLGWAGGSACLWVGF